MRERKYRFKPFASPIGCRLSRYLERQARAGWHLERISGICLFTFVRGEPRDDAIRADFHHVDGDTGAYLQLFADSGWDLICRKWEWVGDYWYFFRQTRSRPGEEPEIYSDADTQIRLYQGYIRFLCNSGGLMLLLLAVLFFPLSLLLLGLSPAESAFVTACGVLGGLASYLVMILLTRRKIRALRANQL